MYEFISKKMSIKHINLLIMIVPGNASTIWRAAVAFTITMKPITYCCLASCHIWEAVCKVYKDFS